MPWEGAELYVADVIPSETKGEITGIAVANAQCIAGKAIEISAAYPSWANNTTLVFTSDVSGYQNPWTYSVTSNTTQPVFSSPVPEDFSAPAWVLGGSPYAFVDGAGNTALFAAFRGGRSVLYLVDLRGGSQPYEVSPCPFASVLNLHQISPGKPEIVFSATKSDGPGGVVRCTLSSSVAPATAIYTVLKSTESSDSASPKFPAGIISVPKSMTLTIPPENDPLHVVFYAPTNPEYDGSNRPEEKPPCVVNVHGGASPRSDLAMVLNVMVFRSNVNGRAVVKLDKAVFYQSWLGMVCYPELLEHRLTIDSGIFIASGLT